MRMNTYRFAYVLCNTGTDFVSSVICGGRFESKITGKNRQYLWRVYIKHYTLVFNVIFTLKIDTL